MALFWRRAVLLLVLVIAVLQVIHMTLLSRLESKRNERRKRVKSDGSKFTDTSLAMTEYRDYEIESDRNRMNELVKESSVLDSSGEFHIINYLMRAKFLGYRNHIRPDVSLITQSSISQLHHLELIALRWRGLISVSVFALSSDIPLAIETIIDLCRCFPFIRYNTSFHLIYPLSVPPPPIGVVTNPSSPSLNTLINKVKDNCDSITKIIESSQSGAINYANSKVPYPNNLLRNVARRNCLTEYVLTIDVDLIPNDGLHENFIEFAKENKLFSDSQKEDKTVYVVPAYEIRINEALSHSSINELIPHDKSSLLQMVELMEARPFYSEICWKCQKYTDYEAWQKEPPSLTLNVLFEVLWRDPWEPFYISRNTVPMYDERFRQYGFNRISQVCELHMSGYKFSVLNNAFVVHRGLKTMDSFHKEKDLEQERNRILFRQFKGELKQKYPESSRRCY